MGFKANVTKNGMSGELYFVITSSIELKMQGKALVRLRSFESRDIVKQALSTGNKTIDGEVTHYVTDEEFEIPLSEEKTISTEDAYKWIRENHYSDAYDVFE